MNSLILERVEKEYETGTRSVAALKGVTFHVAAGDFVALRGPSGCGKSTLLHLAGAMDRPTRGSVEVGGTKLERLSDDELSRFRRKRVGFVFQFFNLLPTLTVLENVALPLLLDGVSERESESRALDLIERVHLMDRVSHYPPELSGGEMQRTSVARAVIATPELVLADEPTGNLDSENGLQVMELLAQLNQELGITVILATHSNEAAARARRIILMKDGFIETDSPNPSDNEVFKTI